MEDEEFYQFMLDDLERLERVHHHVEFVETRRQAERDIDHAPHSPLLSGLMSVVGGAVKTTFEALAHKVTEGGRKWPVSSAH